MQQGGYGGTSLLLPSNYVGRLSGILHGSMKDDRLSVFPERGAVNVASATVAVEARTSPTRRLVLYVVYQE